MNFSLSKYQIVLVCFITISCSQQNAKSDLFEKARACGEVSIKLEEASGLTASYSNSGYLWTINDSGNAAEIFLIDDKAKIAMTCKLTGIKNRDWEDITIGPGPCENSKYLYVGEIGDNEAKYEYKYLYRLPEPIFDGTEQNRLIEKIDTLVISLPDGKRDMESMVIDQTTGDLYLISKREENVNVYYVTAHQLIPGDTIVPEKIETLQFHNVVAVDFTADASELLLKTYDEIYYWKRPDSLSIQEVLSTKPVRLDYESEPQGESLAWTVEGDGFYTLSESVDKKSAQLYFYKRIIK